MAYELFLQWQLCCHRSRDPQIYCPPLWSSSGYNFASGSLLLVNAFLTVDDLSIDWKEWRWFLLLILWRSSYFSLLPHLSSLSAWIFCKTERHRPSINQVFNSFNPRNDLQSIYQVTSHPFPQSRWQAHSCLDQVSLCPQYDSKPEYGKRPDYGKRQDPLERCRGVLDETCRLSGDNDSPPVQIRELGASKKWWSASGKSGSVSQRTKSGRTEVALFVVGGDDIVVLADSDLCSSCPSRSC